MKIPKVPTGLHCAAFSAVKKFVALLAVSLAIVASANAHPDIWWVGGSTGNWNDANNWFDGTTNRLPGSGDTVGFGWADGDNVPNAAQTINLDVDTTVGRLFFYAEGDREVNLNASGAFAISLDGSQGFDVGRIEMLNTAGSTATINVTISGTHNMVNRSDELLNFGPNAVATIGQTFNTPYRVAGGQVNGWWLRHRATIFADGWNHFGTFRTQATGADFRMEGDASLNSLQTFQAVPSNWVTIQRVGAGDRIFELTRITVQTSGNEPSNNNSAALMEVLENTDDAGHLTIRFGGWAEPSARPHPLAPGIRMDDSTTVELVSGGPGLMGIGVVGDEQQTGLTGPGNLHLNMNTPSETFTFQRLTDYTGRTMLEQGTLVMGSETVLSTDRAAEVLGVVPGTYYGSLPTAAIVEIGENATLRLNANHPQTIGGLDQLNGTFGTVDLNGGELTIDAQSATVFPGANITGPGGLVKAGPDTLTLTGDYTAGTGGLVRAEAGEFVVQNTLNVVDANFQPAGGVITADQLLAAGSTWQVTLTQSLESQTLVDVLTADIAGASLGVGLATGYDPAEQTQFTLLYADNQINGASASDMFGFADGALLRIGSTATDDPLWAIINWVPGSDSIVLTVVPEPGSIMLVLSALALALLRCGRRRP